jgi:hypothetical protein
MQHLSNNSMETCENNAKRWFKNLSDHKVFHLDTSLGGFDELLQLSTFKCQFIKHLNSK